MVPFAGLRIFLIGGSPTFVILPAMNPGDGRIVLGKLDNHCRWSRRQRPSCSPAVPKLGLFFMAVLPYSRSSAKSSGC